MGGIGHVCLQMSLLELTLAHIIWAFLDLDHDTGAIVTGGLDILPRINMAINIAEHKKAPLPIKAGLRDIRKALQEGLLDQRNLIVHGAQRFTETNETEFKMLRWPEPKRHQVLSGRDIHAVAEKFHGLVVIGVRVYDDIGTWRFGPQSSPQDAKDDRGGWLARVRLILAKLIHPRV